MKTTDETSRVSSPFGNRFVHRSASGASDGAIPAPHIELHERRGMPQSAPADIRVDEGTSRVLRPVSSTRSIAEQTNAGGQLALGQERRTSPSADSIDQTWIVSDVSPWERYFRNATIVVAPQWRSTVAAFRPPDAKQSGQRSSADLHLAAAALYERQTVGKVHVSLTTAPGAADALTGVTHRIDMPLIHPEAASTANSMPSADRHGRSNIAGQPSSNTGTGSTERTAELACQATNVSYAVDSPGQFEEDLPVAWEVDRWIWPADCEKLVTFLGEELWEAGRQLAAAVHHGLRCLAITGSQRGEGRTTVAMLLARAVARAGTPVALIDADLDNPQLAQLLDVHPPVDWLTAVRSEQPIDESAIYSSQDRIVIVPLRNSLPVVSEPISPEHWQHLLQHWATPHFPLTIVDLGTWNSQRRYHRGDHWRVFQAAVIVRDARTCNSASLETLIRHVFDTGVETIGVIENFARPDSIAAAG